MPPATMVSTSETINRRTSEQTTGALVRVFGDDREARVGMYETICAQLDAAPVLALLPPSADRLPSYRPSLEPLTSEKPMHFGRLPFLRSIPIQTVSIAVLMLALIDKPFVFVGKQELSRIPLFGGNYFIATKYN